MVLTRMRLREPFNALSHGLGAFLSLAGLGLLLYEAEGVRPLLGAFIFGVTLVTLYTSSALYHAVRGSASLITRFQKIDRVAIFGLIAGTTTPIALVSLGGWVGWTMLFVVWLLGGAGSYYVLRTASCSDGILTAIYLAMGWLPLFFIGPLLNQFSPGVLSWVAGGGVAYTVGAGLYLSGWPDKTNIPIGSHGVWHILCMVGSSAHFVFISFYII